ncbi:caspase family protein [Roseibaca sp. V10]|uniref:Caspase family protein n=1 Tax=Roseinatronobacter domitianus TaxID=2940293 RepID=A0ABT0M2X7_9RHOB|nr:caspase family protein [Roseibaca domitiana]MCL1629202.1 caspase family protein [Roseibaca domitiana]
MGLIGKLANLRLAFLAAALAFVVAGTSGAVAQTSADMPRRVALVVGNSSYDALENLPNAGRDARDMADSLEAQGFEVTLLLNSAHTVFDTTIQNFGERAGENAEVVFYYSGHGFQLGGINYLAPVDAVLSGAGDIAAQTLRLDTIISQLSAPGRQTVILLDACRNNPLPPNLREDGSLGLAAPATGRDTFVAFSTQPGNLSYDGRAGENSPFTRALLDNIATEGQSISEMMIEVRNAVETATLGRQTPWDQSSLTGAFFFRPFTPGPEEIAQVAEMAPAMQDFFLSTWARQGARISRDDLLAMAAPEDAMPDPADVASPVAASTPDGTDAASATRIEAPQFDFILIEDDPVAAASAPDVAQQSPAPAENMVIAALPNAGAANPDMGQARALPLRQLSVGAAQGGRAPFIPDAPIARLAALTPAPAPQIPLRRLIGTDATPEDAPEDLATALQTELQRVGCYRMRIDGDWGGGSASALRAFLNETGDSGEDTVPTAEMWRLVRAAEGEICAAPVRTSAPAPAPSPRVTTPRPAAPAPAPPPPAPAPAPSGRSLSNSFGGGFR